MRNVSASFVLGAIGSLWVACAATPPAEVGPPCEREGRACSCDDEVEGTLVCEDDALRCVCEEANDDAGRAMDGGRDGGRDAGPRADARTPDARAPQPDAGADEPDLPDEPAGPELPRAPDDCPLLETGEVAVMGQPVQLWVGEKQADRRGPILFYWHGADATAEEAERGLGRAHEEILAEGGIIASFISSTGSGQTTGGNGVWTTGDFDMADVIIACAVAQHDIDPRRIYTAGCDAGGLQATAMAYARSSYLAAAVPDSGGAAFPYQLEDATHVPAFMGAHGAAGVDKVVVDFVDVTQRAARDFAAKGGYAIVCDHGGGHCESPASVKNAQWQFLKDHPWGVDPLPYTEGLPASFPTACKVVEK